jgi:hypothetical protein
MYGLTGGSRFSSRIRCAMLKVRSMSPQARVVRRGRWIGRCACAAGPRTLPAQSRASEGPTRLADRLLYKAPHDLEALQKQRRGEAAPLARIAVHGLPGD